MAKFLKFNLNDFVLVQITEKGWEHLKKTLPKDYIEICIVAKKVVVQDVDYFKIQGHELISLFNHPKQFNTNIFILMK